MELTELIVRGLRELAPLGWERMDAWFAVTVVAESAVVVAEVGVESVRCAVPEPVWRAVREHRWESARSGGAPWWRLAIRLEADSVEVEVDHGAEVFPAEQLFAPAAYLADLEVFPRARLPVWLAAYIGRGVPQSRPPRQAAAEAAADRLAGVTATPVPGELPDPATLWARWAVLSAAFVAAGSEWGPRIGPGVGTFESAGHSGSTLVLLPGGRAVLSGGVWNAPILDAGYNTGAPFPKIMAGAPDWVADPVLNPRVATGWLSFCYWWDSDRWYRGESDPVPDCAPALPAVWTADTVLGVIAALAVARTPEFEDAARVLLAAAQESLVTRETVRHAFGADEQADLAGALYQFTLAGLIAGDTGRIGAATAISMVHRHIHERGYDTAGYPLSTLAAERIAVGWVVRAPVTEGEIALDRAVFYVADDGVVERCFSSVPHSVYAAGFEERFRQRRDGRPRRREPEP